MPARRFPPLAVQTISRIKIAIIAPNVANPAQGDGITAGASAGPASVPVTVTPVGANAAIAAANKVVLRM